MDRFMSTDRLQKSMSFHFKANNSLRRNPVWKETTRYAAVDDWVFASPRRKGKRPLRPEGVLSKIIRAAALRAGIKKRIGWHTFRHTYSSTLIANGENVKVVQELMRHASSRFTLEVYTQAKARAKRDAQQRIVEMMLPEEGLASDLRLQRSQPDEQLGDWVID
jgi:site-specific recombinase XerD